MAFSRTGANYNNNQTQKVLTYSMQKRDSSLGKRRSTSKINDALGAAAVSLTTVGNWLEKIKKSGFSLNKLLHASGLDKPYDLSTDSVSALVVDEWSNDKKKSAQNASTRLQGLFPSNKDKFKLEVVQVSILIISR